MSDSFLETTMPLIMLIEAAQAGNEREVEECAKLFIDHAAKLEEVRAARGKGIPSQLAQNNSYLKTICVNLIVWRLGGLIISTLDSGSSGPGLSSGTLDSGSSGPGLSSGTLDSGSSGPGLSSGQYHFVVFLSKTLSISK